MEETAYVARWFISFLSTTELNVNQKRNFVAKDSL